jgi:hypothetical protein
MRFSHHILPLSHGLSVLLTRLRHLISPHSFFANDILSTNRPLVPLRCFMLYPLEKETRDRPPTVERSSKNGRACQPQDLGFPPQCCVAPLRQKRGRLVTAYDPCRVDTFSMYVRTTDRKEDFSDIGGDTVPFCVFLS